MWNVVDVVDASFGTNSGDMGKSLGRALKSACAHGAAELTVCVDT